MSGLIGANELTRWRLQLPIHIALAWTFPSWLDEVIQDSCQLDSLDTTSIDRRVLHAEIDHGADVIWSRSAIQASSRVNSRSSCGSDSVKISELDCAHHLSFYQPTVQLSKELIFNLLHKVIVSNLVPNIV